MLALTFQSEGCYDQLFCFNPIVILNHKLHEIKLIIRENVWSYLFIYNKGVVERWVLAK